MNNTAQQNGVINYNSVKEYSDKYNNLHLPRILSCMIVRFNQFDNQKQRENLIPRHNHLQFLLDVLSMYRYRCDVCKVILTIKQDKWTDVSFDRIDNSKGHFVQGNLRTVCSLHQVSGINKFHNHATHLHMLLVQKHFELDNKTRIAVQSEHDSIDQTNKFDTCHLCQLDI